MDISEVRDQVVKALKTSEGFSDVSAFQTKSIGMNIDGERYFLTVEPS
jgi:hypothetical protein